ncbi:multidrug MFS transporter [Gordonibacter sp. 28C]|uniref:MFS transporter n=1 Tax=Gordonibacter sp. 28C TaxID=2078569 RepID=UPI000DF80F9D|nr:MFS transporter [Gordonibacter sp. 28C]RDB60427.1 multidrug MFS transporter [Gordonibacter sp. 28C]
MSSTPIRNAAAVLFTVAFATLLATFNETFLNVALTPIMADFGIDAGTVQWVTTAYMLAAAVMVPVTGFLYRSVPTKRLLIVALALLLAGTVAGAFAPSFPALLAGRIVQALGTGMIVPIGMNLTLAVAPQGKLGTYMGVVSAMTTLGPAFGPIVAGAVLAAGSWHMLFAVFGVLVVACLIAAVAFVPDAAELTNPKLDLASTVLVGLALIGILYGISTAFSGATAIAAIALVAGVGCLVGFVARQRVVPEPLIDLRPFSNRGFVCGLLVIVIALMTVFSMNMILPLFMQGSLGFSALDAAMTLLPACVLSCVLAPVAGKVYDRFGLRLMLPAGLALMTAFGFALSTCTEQAGSLQIVAFYAPVIIGCALSMGPAQSFALSSLKPELYPHGVTVVSTSFQIAGCLGSSLFVGVLSGVQAASLAQGADAAVATAGGFQTACLVAVALGAAGFCLSLALGRIERKRRAKNAPAAKAAAQAL